MAGRSSAEKRHRQSEDRRIRNKSAKSAVRTSAKKVLLAVQKKNADEAQAALREMSKKIDTAAGKGIIKKNAAARKKSRMAHLVNALSQNA
jgi:small subunit ribosomal protein S20